ncbi:hypothetical protein OIU78_025670 [Salix suchowensis]|nr:hypothetical protein OIU78_025670 [Salix suchowensis]
MDKQEQTCHVVLIPYPVQGHINPMIQFSKLLAAKGLHVTLVIFSGQTLLTHHDSLGSVKVVAISDGYDRGSISIGDYLQQFQATVTQKLPRLVVELDNIAEYASFNSMALKNFAYLYQVVNWLETQRSIKLQTCSRRLHGMARFKGTWLCYLCVIWKLGCSGRRSDGRDSLGAEEEWLLFHVGGQRIGGEKTPLQLCGGFVGEGSDRELEPAVTGSGSQVCRLFHDSLRVELHT